MKDDEIDCPRCGQPWVGRNNSPFWQEARFRAGGRAQTPMERSEKAADIPGGLCGVCGAPLPKRKGRRKGEREKILTVLPADSTLDEEEIPTVLPADALDTETDYPRRRHRPRANRRRGERSDSFPASWGVLSPFVCILLGLGVLTLLLLPLSFFSVIPAGMLIFIGIVGAVAGMGWSWKYYSENDYESPPISIRLLGGSITRFIYHGLHALQDPTGIGRPFLLEVLGIFLILVGTVCVKIAPPMSFGPFAPSKNPPAVKSPTPARNPPFR